MFCKDVGEFWGPPGSCISFSLDWFPPSVFVGIVSTGLLSGVAGTWTGSLWEIGVSFGSLGFHRIPDLCFPRVPAVLSRVPSVFLGFPRFSDGSISFP